jgi:CheY-like chemotaxis protein
MPDRLVPAIALSAFAREEDRTRAASVGFDLYVTKPFEVEQLIDHIRQVAKAG